MKMHLEKTAVSYSVEIEMKQFSALLDYEDAFNGGLKGSEQSIDETLRKMGCSDVEYNGHYLNYIYFTISIDDDNRKFHNKVLNVIEKQIKKAELWKLEMVSEH